MTAPPEHDWHDLISGRATTRLFKAGEIISWQHDEPEFVGYIVSGRAQAISYSENGDATWIGYFEPKQFFGQISLLTQSPTGFEVSAETDVTVLMIGTEAMRDILSNDSALMESLAANVASRLSDMTQRFVEAYTLSAKGRVCAELDRLSKVIGVAPETSIIRPVPIFVEVALRVNSTRETVSRTVSDLQKKSVIKREPGALIIEKPEQLKALIR